MDIKKLSKNEVEEKFYELTRELMTENEFNKWLVGWLDINEVLRDVRDWSVEQKREVLEEYKNWFKEEHTIKDTIKEIKQVRLNNNPKYSALISRKEKLEDELNQVNKKIKRYE